jgi:hypothetical protein
MLAHFGDFLDISDGLQAQLELPKSSHVTRLRWSAKVVRLHDEASY